MEIKTAFKHNYKTTSYLCRNYEGSELTEVSCLKVNIATRELSVLPAFAVDQGCLPDFFLVAVYFENWNSSWTDITREATLKF